jgi:16S rRNA C1402 (ribose-2'-O) methylase RsmI
MKTTRPPAELKRPTDIDTRIETGVALHQAWEEIDRLRAEVRRQSQQLEDLDVTRHSAVTLAKELAKAVEQFLMGHEKRPLHEAVELLARTEAVREALS